MLYDIEGEIHQELDDARFATKTHGRRSTYMAGCRGPLCRKSERDAKNDAYRRSKKGSPILEYTPRPERMFDTIIEEAQQLHNAERVG